MPSFVEETPERMDMGESHKQDKELNHLNDEVKDGSNVKNPKPPDPNQIANWEGLDKMQEDNDQGM